MNSILSTLVNLISIISPVIIFGTCCYFLTKKAAVEAVLMTIGSGIGLLTSLFYSVLMPFLINDRHFAYTEVSKYYTVIGIISFIASLCFAGGLLILIINTVKKNTTNYDQFPKSID
ncbi:flagellar biosynthesis component FlhA [Flavobacterium sp. W4I14]|nr:flagellar biosynthesis component FlhA [Flavobacterium sp. W4I14]